MTDDKAEALRLLVSDLANISAALATELWRNKLLDPQAALAIGNAFARLAEDFEDDDPRDPDEMDATAAILNSAALLLRRDGPQ